MVNVPGRSKGCNTCRRRRVKCDEKKPICERCTKADFECLGYERERIWRNASSASFPMVASMGKSTMISNESTRAPMEMTSPAPELSLIAFRDNICLTFMFANHVWRASGALWLEQAASGKLGKLSLNATYALSQANFGRSHHHATVERQGVMLYGKSLQMLAGQLADNTSGDPEMIVPILVMIMHAGSQGDRNGSIFHLRGLARLLHLCGPAAFQRQPLLNAFEAARAILLVAALIGKQRLFLDEESWRTVPWLQYPEFKTWQSKLLDILVVIPGILQDYATWNTSLQPISMLRVRFITRVKKQLVKLYQWRWEWQARCGHEVSVDSTHKLPQVCALRPFGRLQFSRFGAAIELMLYDAISMWLLALLLNLDFFGATQQIELCAIKAMPKNIDTVRLTPFQPLRRPGAAVTIRDPALEICRVFEWVSRHHGCNREPGFLYLLPIGMAITAFQEEPDLMAWVRALLGTSPVTAGYAEGDNQAGFGFYLARGALLNPETVQATEQLFSRQDMSHLEAI